MKPKTLLAALHLAISRQKEAEECRRINKYERARQRAIQSAEGRFIAGVTSDFREQIKREIRE